MSSYTHFNVVFKSKSKKTLSKLDYDKLKKDIFSNKMWPEYSKFLSTSILGMLIFELDEGQNCVYLEMTPIRAHYLTDILDVVRDKGEFEIFSICTWEEGVNYLEIYNNDYRENRSASCIYQSDEIRLKLKRAARQFVKPNGFIKIEENQFQLKGLFLYHDNNVVVSENQNMLNSISNSCLRKNRQKYLLSNCIKQEPESDWFSESNICTFIKNLENIEFSQFIESVEFKFKGEVTRLYDNGEFTKCHMLGDWHNLDPQTFENVIPF